MATLREWLTRLWGTLRPGRRDADLEAELRLHLELAAENGRRRANGSERRRAGSGDAVRGHGAGDGGGARSARSAVARRSGSRPAVWAPRLAPEPALHVGRGADARARHRREHGDLLPGGCRAPAGASRHQPAGPRRAASTRPRRGHLPVHLRCRLGSRPGPRRAFRTRCVPSASGHACRRQR